jgi:HAD superfamily hydrolase (TIGR01490 family)
MAGGARSSNERTGLTHELAIYDMDKTITRVPTYAGFLRHAAMRLAPWRLALLPLVGLAGLAYGLRWIDRQRLKEISHHLLLGPHTHKSELATVAASFAEKTIMTNVHPGALEAIAQDRAAGRRLVMATASYRLYVEAIAEQLGFDDVVATNSLTGLDERITARIDGENCYGPAKLRMIIAWMKREGIIREDAHIRFYSDHASDAPVLEWSDAPHAVNAHDRLRKLAKRNGWAIVDWGD